MTAGHCQTVDWRIGVADLCSAMCGEEDDRAEAACYAFDWRATEVANARESLGQEVLQKAAQKFLASQGHGALLL